MSEGMGGVFMYGWRKSVVEGSHEVGVEGGGMGGCGGPRGPV